jgi:hypothetical protein
VDATLGFAGRAIIRQSKRAVWLLLVGMSWMVYPQTAPCPWLNVATASGALGGPATLQARISQSGMGECLFRETDEDTWRTLKIEVHLSKDAKQEIAAFRARCASPATEVRGVGNEAVSCSANAKTAPMELVTGFVRDQVFTILLTTSTKSDPFFSSGQLRQYAENIAGQVSGSLF